MSRLRFDLRLAAGLLPLVILGCFEGKPESAGQTPQNNPSATGHPSGNASQAVAHSGTAPEVRGDSHKEGGKTVSNSSSPAVDPKSLIDVVKGDLQGGESKKNPTPINCLWLPSDKSLIQDEPLTVTPPLGLEPLAARIPAANPLTKGKVELGRQLYFDARISKDTTVSCATCHNPEKAWTDQAKTSTGIKGQVGGRSAPTVLNTVFGRTMFWDGRAASLEAQAQGPPQNPIEMGDQTYQQIIERLRTIPGYRDQFRKVFGTDVTLDGVAKAIASFERVTALSGGSSYDKYDRGDSADSLKALSDSAKRGMVLFGLRLRQDDDFRAGVPLKKAGCTSCHAGQNFSDEEFHNLGAGWNAKEGKFADLGRFVIEAVGAKNEKSIGAFKTPTVRDVARTAPYMHDGSEATLLAVVEFYDKGGNPNPSLDKDIQPLKLLRTPINDTYEVLAPTRTRSHQDLSA